MSEINYFYVIVEKDEIVLNSNLRKDSITINKLNLNVSSKTRRVDYRNKRKFYSVLGVVDCEICDYLILVSKVKLQGRILDANLFSVEEVINP
jgi:hypothetical protein